MVIKLLLLLRISHITRAHERRMSVCVHVKVYVCTRRTRLCFFPRQQKIQHKSLFLRRQLSWFCPIPAPSMSLRGHLFMHVSFPHGIPRCPRPPPFRRPVVSTRIISLANLNPAFVVGAQTISHRNRYPVYDCTCCLQSAFNFVIADSMQTIRLYK